MIKYKTCTKCKETKMIAMFFKSRTTIDGRCYTCQQCQLEYKKNRRKQLLVEV